MFWANTVDRSGSDSAVKTTEIFILSVRHVDETFIELSRLKNTRKIIKINIEKII